ncbi:hypothetical protein QOT17_017189 [Balamuthia mandrillaris]
MHDKPNLRPLRTKRSFGSTVRNKQAMVENELKKSLRYVRFVYDPETRTHRQEQCLKVDSFGLLPEQTYSLNKDDRWGMLSQLKKNSEYTRLCLNEETKLPTDETAIVLLQTNEPLFQRCHIPFVRLSPDQGEGEAEEEFIYKKTRSGREVVKKNKSSRKQKNPSDARVIHEGEVLVYFWSGESQGKKQTRKFTCSCCQGHPAHVSRAARKHSFMNELLRGA